MSVTRYDLNDIKNDYSTKHSADQTLDQNELTDMLVTFGLTKTESTTLAIYLKQVNGNNDLTAEKVLELLDGDDDDHLDQSEVKIASQMAKENNANANDGDNLGKDAGKANFKATATLFTDQGTIDSEKLKVELGKLVGEDGTLKTGDEADKAKDHIRLALVATGLSEAEANQIIEFLTDTNTSKDDRKAFATSLIEATKATTTVDENSALRNTIAPEEGGDDMPELKTATNGNYKYYESADVKEKISNGNKVDKEGLVAFLNGVNIPDPSNGGKKFTTDSPLVNYLSNLTPDQVVAFLNNMGPKGEVITPEDARLGIQAAYEASIMHKNRKENTDPAGTYNLRANDVREFLSANQSRGDVNVPADVMKQKLQIVFAEMGLEVTEAKLNELAGKSIEEILKILNGGTDVGTGDDAMVNVSAVKTALGNDAKVVKATGDSTGGSPTEGEYSLDSEFSVTDFAAAIKSGDGNTIDKAKLAALLVDMDIAKDQTAATALAEQLVTRQGVTTPEDLANALKGDGDAASDKISAKGIMVNLYAKGDDVDKSDFKDMLPKLTEEARKQLVQRYIPSYTGSNMNNDEVTNILFGSEENIDPGKLFGNAASYNKGHQWTKEEFTSYLGNSTGTKLQDKLANMMKALGIVTDDADGAKSKELAKQMLDNYRAAHGGSEPSASELFDFINANNKSTAGTFDTKEFSQAIYTNAESDPKKFNASKLTFLLDRSTAEQKKDILKDILITQGGETAEKAEEIITKLNALGGNNQIADALLSGGTGEPPMVDVTKLKSNIAGFKTAQGIS